MAHKKAAGSAKNLRDSKPKYRGVKVFGGQQVQAGDIIVRQKGQQFVGGANTYLGRDATIHANIAGVVVFKKKNIMRFDGRKFLKTIVTVQGAATQPAESAAVDAPKKAVSKTKTPAKKTTSTPKKAEPKTKKPAKKVSKK